MRCYMVNPASATTLISIPKQGKKGSICCGSQVSQPSDPYALKFNGPAIKLKKPKDERVAVKSPKTNTT
eukprot:c35909_g1_i1 orf=531-737(-)